MKKLLFLSSALWLAACEGPIFGDKKAPVFVVDSPYAFEQMDDMMLPDVYALAATRSVNKMLDQSSDIYEKDPVPKLYITEFKKLSKSLPDGLYYAKDTTKQIIDGSRTYTVVNNLNDADYYLETQIKEILPEGAKAPIIEYKIVLNDKDNNKINEWTETIRQLQNDDKSWW